ncbi:MAG: hypothetical protein WBA57_20020 [Elainellaceae cyanobacterium]
MLFILVVVIALVSWALHLMQQAVDKREFSLMLAGLLVSSAAAALVGVYVLMSSCVATMTQMSHDSSSYSDSYYSNYSYIEPVYKEQAYSFNTQDLNAQDFSAQDIDARSKAPLLTQPLEQLLTES